MDVPLTPDEVQTLASLHKVSAPGERFATNKHEASNVVEHTERSYAYAALAQRPVLVEGFLYHQLRTFPGFDGLLSDNDLMFTTTEPGTCMISRENGRSIGFWLGLVPTSRYPDRFHLGWLSSRTAAASNCIA